MKDIARIPIPNLLIDVSNPRLADIQPNQAEALRSIASQQKGKLLALAYDVIEYGVDPSTLPIVVSTDPGSADYFVLEGNRRIAVIKILENPEVILGAVDKNLYHSFAELAKDYRSSPIKAISCVILDSEQAKHWIELRHTGENKGAGVVRWGGAETARFRQRSGDKEFHLQVLEFLEQRGDLDPHDRKVVPVTSLKRLLTSPYVRAKLGIDLRDGEIVTRFDEAQVAKGLKRVVGDLSTRRIKTKDIYTREDRINYIDGIAAAELPDTSRPKAATRPLASQSATGVRPASEPEPMTAGTLVPSGKTRPNLIPPSYRISIDKPKVNEIFHELRELEIESYTNAVSVLLRVFLELSLDVFIAKNRLSTTEKDTLGRKLRSVAQFLRSTGKIDDQQMKSIEQIANKNSFLAVSITTLHQYVHNPYFSPQPSDLRAAWNNVDYLLAIIWK